MGGPIASGLEERTTIDGRRRHHSLSRPNRQQTTYSVRLKEPIVRQSRFDPSHRSTSVDCSRHAIPSLVLKWSVNTVTVHPDRSIICSTIDDSRRPFSRNREDDNVLVLEHICIVAKRTPKDSMVPISSEFVL